MMNLLGIKSLEVLVEIRGKGRDVSDSCILDGLSGGAGAGNDCRHGSKVQNPSLAHLCHCHSIRQEASEMLCKFHAFLKRDPRKCFADIEMRSIAIEIPVVTFSEGTVSRELATQ